MRFTLLLQIVSRAVIPLLPCFPPALGIVDFLFVPSGDADLGHGGCEFNFMEG